MKVYHSSNVKIKTLNVGSYVTPDMEISKIFGKEKLGNKHYLHVFNASERRYPTRFYNGMLILDLDSDLIGELDKATTPEGEDWQNYLTTKILTPIQILEY